MNNLFHNIVYKNMKGIPSILSRAQSSDMGVWNHDFIRGVAAAVGDLTEINAKYQVMKFKRNGVEYSIFPHTKTVETKLRHPKQGLTSLKRTDCTDGDLLNILKDPRHHTGKGKRVVKLGNTN